MVARPRFSNFSRTGALFLLLAQAIRIFWIMPVPPTLVIGDLWAFSWASTVYSRSDGYGAQFTIALGQERFSADGVDGESDREWLFSIPPSETETAEPPGTWLYWVIVSNPIQDERFTVEQGEIKVLPNPLTGPVRPPTEKEKTLALAIETRRKLVSSEVAVATFQSHQYTLWDIEKLDKVIRRLEDEVANEGPEAGKHKFVYTRFRQI